MATCPNRRFCCILTDECNQDCESHPVRERFQRSRTGQSFHWFHNVPEELSDHHRACIPWSCIAVRQKVSDWEHWRPQQRAARTTYVLRILKRIEKFHDPITVCKCHDVSLFPEERAIRAFELNAEWNAVDVACKWIVYHFEFTECFHCIHLTWCFAPYELYCSECTATDEFDRFEIVEVDPLLADVSRWSMICNE